MKIINLDKAEKDTFYLGKQKLVYSYDENDAALFWQGIKELDLKDEEKFKNGLKQLFELILSRENGKVEIKNEDLFGLLNYFLRKFVK